MSDDFPAFALSEEHEALREAVRALADDKIAPRTLDHTRITIAAQALGIAQGALNYALGYVKERKQFGRAVADFQGLQFMLADMAMKLEAARQLTYAAAAECCSIWPRHGHGCLAAESQTIASSPG